MIEMNETQNGWTIASLEDLLDYIQPTKYIVVSTEYDDKFNTPVLTAGKSFILGNTNETNGIFDEIPVIIFDDFTTATKFVNFQFKVKSSAMKILKPTSKLVSLKYTFYYMQTIRITVDTHKRYWISNYSQLPISLPPLPEQHRIVAKIEELFSSLDKGIESLKTAQQQLKIYRQAVLGKAFEGTFTKEWIKLNSSENANTEVEAIKAKREKIYRVKIDQWTLDCQVAKVKNTKKPNKPKKPYTGSSISQEEKEVYTGIRNSWALIRFIDLIKYEEDALKRGPFGSAIKKSFFVTSGYKVYEQQNAINNVSTLGKYYITEEKYNELIGFSVKPGDYIVSCSGTIGKIMKLPENCDPGVINQALMKIRLDEELMESKYFLYLFRAEIFQRRILKGTRGTGMQNLAGIDEIKDLIIPLPPKKEQIAIIQEIETRLSVCDKLEESITQSLWQAEALRQSILKKAFEGKLVPQDPNDESASVLLERIRAERGKKAAIDKKGKRT